VDLKLISRTRGIKYKFSVDAEKNLLSLRLVVEMIRAILRTLLHITSVPLDQVLHAYFIIFLLSAQSDLLLTRAGRKFFFSMYDNIAVYAREIIYPFVCYFFDTNSISTLSERTQFHDVCNFF